MDNVIGAACPVYWCVSVLRVALWDTAGQERYNTLHPAYYHGAHVCILVFDATRPETYKHLNGWYSELHEHRSGCPVIVLANKIDVVPEVTGKSFKFPTKHGLKLFYVSAASGANVVDAFERSLELGIENYDST